MARLTKHERRKKMKCKALLSAATHIFSNKWDKSLCGLNPRECRKITTSLISTFIQSPEQVSESQNHLNPASLSMHNRFQVLQNPRSDNAEDQNNLIKESLATLNTGKFLEVNLLSSDEIVLKQMIEVEFARCSQMTERWKELF